MRFRVTAAFLVSLLITGTAGAIDCRLAGSWVEKRICSSDKLTQMDLRLNELYENVIKVANDPQQLRHQQKKWLTQVRSKCVTNSCLEEVYRKRASAIQSAPKSPLGLYSVKELGIEFPYPTSRIVFHNGKNIYIQGTDMPANASYYLHLEVGDGDLEVAKKRTFESVSGVATVASDRFDSQMAEPIEGNGWRGLRTKLACEVEDDTDRGRECIWVILSNGTRYVVVNTEGILPLDEETDKSLMSIKFLPML